MSKRNNLGDLIARANEIHDAKYTYENFVYEGMHKASFITCPIHGDFKKTMSDHIKGGQGCPICSKERRTEKNCKYSDEDFRSEIKKIYGDKYDVSGLKYTRGDNKVTLVCPIHGEFTQTIRRLLDGFSCQKCDRADSKAKKGHNTEGCIFKFKEKWGEEYDYSKFNYVNYHTDGIIICRKHGEFLLTPSEHMRGTGCKQCLSNSLSFRRKRPNEDFIELVKELHGDKFTFEKTDVYHKDENGKVCITCKKHGDFWITPNSILSGHGCKLCSDENRAEMNRMPSEYFFDLCRKQHNGKYGYHDDYGCCRENIRITCPIHGDFYQNAKRHLSGQGCPECAKEICVSRPEIELRDFISEEYQGIIIKNDRKILDNMFELDIYLPEIKTAIEFDGLYWHGEMKKDNAEDYHLNKTEECEKKGIRLIHIFEDEWVYKQEIVKSRLRNILGISTASRIYARKCEIREVSFADSQTFLNDNHIQGSCVSKHNYGLYYEGELVSLMTFGSLRVNLGNKKSENGEFELLRFCNKANTIVTGGASRLLKHFVREMKPKKIISYADRRWSQGDIYDKLGFKEIRISRPNYFYVIGDRRENRFKYRKSELVKQGFDASKTEHEIMLERGIYRIYDCGTKVYLINF